MEVEYARHAPEVAAHPTSGVDGDGDEQPICVIAWPRLIADEHSRWLGDQHDASDEYRSRQSRAVCGVLLKALSREVLFHSHERQTIGEIYGQVQRVNGDKPFSGILMACTGVCLIVGSKRSDRVILHDRHFSMILPLSSPVACLNSTKTAVRWMSAGEIWRRHMLEIE